jgi:hypothetical protein
MSVWGVRPAAVPGALGRMALDRVRLRSAPGLRFVKLLGTGDGRTFTVRDADPLHWAVLTVWDDHRAAAAFPATATSRGWDRLATERLDVTMTPLTARGTWSGRAPFTPGAAAGGTAVASITRARIRPTKALRFWRSVPPVSADLGQVPGLLLALGIGEAPIGLQGTFSLWRSQDDLAGFAYRRRAHVDVVKRTPTEGWYAEELFARFAVHTVEGTFGGRVLC